MVTEGVMAYLKNRTAILFLLGIWFFIFGCAAKQEITTPKSSANKIFMEFVGNQIELLNPLPRDGEVVDIFVTVRNRSKQEVRRIPVYFYDNLRVFSTEEVDLEPGGERRLSARWRATKGSHSLSVKIDPAHHFDELRRERTEVSITVLVK